MTVAPEPLLHHVDLIKSFVQLGAAGLLLVGLLVVARVFSHMWIEMRDAEQRAIVEARNWTSSTLASTQKIAETLGAAVTEARALTLELREMSRDLRSSKNV